MCDTVSAAHVLRMGVATSQDQPAHWTLIGRCACQSSLRLRPSSRQIMKQQRSASSLTDSSGWIHGINVAPNVSCVIFFSFPADILVLRAAVCLCGRKVSGLLGIKPETWSFRHPVYSNGETGRNKAYMYIYCVSMHLLNDDELVWQRQLVLASFVHPSCLHWDSTEGLLQWNTRENPSASAYRQNPYLLLKLEAEMCVG